MGCSNGGIKKGTQAIFVVGGPFSGKTKQCNLIENAFGWTNICVNDVIQRNETENLERIDRALMDFNVVSSTQLISFIKQEVTLRRAKRILLDGFPKSHENIKEWNKELSEIEVLAILYFKCSVPTMKARMATVSHEIKVNKEKASIKIENYEKEIESILEKYDSERKVIIIEGDKSREEVFEDVKKAFILKKLID